MKTGRELYNIVNTAEFLALYACTVVLCGFHKNSPQTATKAKNTQTEMTENWISERRNKEKSEGLLVLLLRVVLIILHLNNGCTPSDFLSIRISLSAEKKGIT